MPSFESESKQVKNVLEGQEQHLSESNKTPDGFNALDLLKSAEDYKKALDEQNKKYPINRKEDNDNGILPPKGTVLEKAMDQIARDKDKSEN